MNQSLLYSKKTGDIQIIDMSKCGQLFAEHFRKELEEKYITISEKQNYRKHQEQYGKVQDILYKPKSYEPFLKVMIKNAPHVYVKEVTKEVWLVILKDYTLKQFVEVLKAHKLPTKENYKITVLWDDMRKIVEKVKEQKRKNPKLDIGIYQAEDYAIEDLLANGICHIKVNKDDPNKLMLGVYKNNKLIVKDVSMKIWAYFMGVINKLKKACSVIYDKDNVFLLDYNTVCKIEARYTEERIQKGLHQLKPWKEEPKTYTYRWSDGNGAGSRGTESNNYTTTKIKAHNLTDLWQCIFMSLHGIPISKFEERTLHQNLKDIIDDGSIEPEDYSDKEFKEELENWSKPKYIKDILEDVDLGDGSPWVCWVKDSKGTTIYKGYDEEEDYEEYD